MCGFRDNNTYFKCFLEGLKEIDNVDKHPSQIDLDTDCIYMHEKNHKTCVSKLIALIQFGIIWKIK